MNNDAETNRRTFSRTVAGAAGLMWAAAGESGSGQVRSAEAPRPVGGGNSLRMKMTKAEPIMTGTYVFIRIETDAGITGYGDGTQNFLPYAVEGNLKDLIPYLIGEDPERIEYLWQPASAAASIGAVRLPGAAVSAIDQALWDIKGKAYGVPVYQLLGGLARTKVRLYGHVSGNTADEAARQAKQRADKGITAIRFKGVESYDAQNLSDHKLCVAKQIEYLAAIRKAVGNDIYLILECHGRYDPEWAIELAQRAEPYHPFLIEDPIRHENPQALAQVRAQARAFHWPRASLHDLWDFGEIITNSYVNYLRPDVCHCGGD